MSGYLYVCDHISRIINHFLGACRTAIAAVSLSASFLRTRGETPRDGNTVAVAQRRAVCAVAAALLRAAFLLGPCWPFFCCAISRIVFRAQIRPLGIGAHPRRCLSYRFCVALVWGPAVCETCPSRIDRAFFRSSYDSLVVCRVWRRKPDCDRPSRTGELAELQIRSALHPHRLDVTWKAAMASFRKGGPQTAPAQLTGCALSAAAAPKFSISLGRVRFARSADHPSTTLLCLEDRGNT